MFTTDREYFYQWDRDIELTVNSDEIKQVHFCNKTDNCSLVVEVENGKCVIPNVLLTNSLPLLVYGFDGKQTKYCKRFEILPKNKPEDYIYTDEDLKQWEELEKSINELREYTDSELKRIQRELDGAIDSQSADIMGLENSIMNLNADIDSYEMQVNEIADDIGLVNTRVTTLERNQIGSKGLEGNYSEVFNVDNWAYGNYSHAQGFETEAQAHFSHSEGFRCIATGQASHAQGSQTRAKHEASFTSGLQLDTGRSYQSVFGRWNVADSEALLLVGYGTRDQKKNCFSVDTNGKTKISNLVLTSPDGSLFTISVGNDGTLTATKL